ncbi:MAG: ribonuclease H-like domain-containing protein [Lachnospiraceae bacterium]|nr:ribonuclease H-like domain-containing protein [Lachnospiraceae bacterium]
MQTLKNTVSDQNMRYPVERLGDPEKLLFVDIETTGLSPKNSVIYLIGCLYVKNGTWRTVQFFADNTGEEESVLYSFYNFALNFDTLITFNGNRFDIPFIQEKLAKYDMPFDLYNYKGVDIYKRLRPYKALFSLPDLKQKTIESFLDVERDDEKSGSELIKVYEEYTRMPSEFALNLILQHNYDDICGMKSILVMLAYSDLFNEPIKAEKAVRNNYKDYNGYLRSELIIEFSFPVTLPKPVSAGFTDCYLMIGGNKGKLRISMFTGTLKFFYPNYKDYYYLPDEDRAIHKSVGTYVDKEHRVQASASNCYAKKKGVFLPEWDEILTPVFYENYRDNTMYFELGENLKNDPDVFTKYASHIMETIMKEA